VEVAVITACIDPNRQPIQPWISRRETLATRGIDVRLFEGRAIREAFERPFDMMLLHVWQDWSNRLRFDPMRILPLLEAHSAYRARFPSTRQIAHHHSDANRPPLALLTWRVGDWVLYRTPPYDRSVLLPFPADRIWAYEQVWGDGRLASAAAPRWAAGFIGTPTGPAGYRARVARATARVGIGLCLGGGTRRWRRAVPRALHDWIMARCRIMVCPRGWGQQSSRHWDAWRSGKPVLTDRACAVTEMIPGERLEPGVHYLVYDEPEEIPDIVADWTRPGRASDLAAVAENGRVAALRYDPAARIGDFFERVMGLGGGASRT
jgi:hypothetical protein